MLKLVYFCFFFITYVQSSLFNAHSFPSQGPFFEGWYIKTMDFDNKFSFANIIAKHLSDTNKNTGYLGFLVSDDVENQEKPMQTYDFFSDGFQYNDCNDFEIISNPDISSAPCLNLYPISNDKSIQGYMKANGESIEVHWAIKTSETDFKLDLFLTNHTTWDDSGLGPQGITSLIPKLGLYWFVFSVKSYAKYKITINDKVYQGTGFTHIEKNWGDSFPDSWMWAEGMSILSNNQSVEFALAGGPKQLGPIPISPVLYLVGYRSSKFEWSFHPQDIFIKFDVSHDSCVGEFNLTVRTPTTKLVIRIKSDIKSFKNCLFGPSKEGMKPMCLESFSAIANIEAYTTSNPFGSLFDNYNLEESVEIPMSALEFGGGYLKPCFSCDGTTIN